MLLCDTFLECSQYVDMPSFVTATDACLPIYVARIQVYFKASARSKGGRYQFDHEGVETMFSGCGRARPNWISQGAKTRVEPSS